MLGYKTVSQASAAKSTSCQCVKGHILLNHGVGHHHSLGLALLYSYCSVGVLITKTLEHM